MFASWFINTHGTDMHPWRARTVGNWNRSYTVDAHEDRDPLGLSFSRLAGLVMIIPMVF